MDLRLRSYLESHAHHHETTERWPIQGEMKVRLCLATTMPPPDAISSILAIVMNANREVLFLWPSNPSGSIAHVLIGGRSLGDETPEETVIREVGEETGWHVRPTRMIGFRHFFHLDPRSPATDRPYPNFVQPIFAATAVEFEPTRIVSGDRIAGEFIDFSAALRLTELGQRPLLQSAADAVGER
jgi:ADP-ribose pyrophosphatase YjhB (NUDIX family)